MEASVMKTHRFIPIQTQIEADRGDGPGAGGPAGIGMIAGRGI